MARERTALSGAEIRNAQLSGFIVPAICTARASIPPALSMLSSICAWWRVPSASSIMNAVMRCAAATHSGSGELAKMNALKIVIIGPLSLGCLS